MLLRKFLKNEQGAIREYYNTYGYVVVEKLFDSSKIEQFLNYYEEIKRSRFFVFFSQATHLPIQPKLTPEGFIENFMHPYISNALHYVRHIANFFKGRGTDYNMRGDSYV